jgi:hypothetical protein
MTTKTQMLTNIYTERDVADVESYVRAAVMRGIPGIASEERERLVARGILLVRRIARALPPETSLDRVLRERLEGALSVYGTRGARVVAGPAEQAA